MGSVLENSEGHWRSQRLQEELGQCHHDLHIQGRSEGYGLLVLERHLVSLTMSCLQLAFVLPLFCKPPKLDPFIFTQHSYTLRLTQMEVEHRFTEWKNHKGHKGKPVFLNGVVS